MLFDLRGRGRRRFVKVIYIGLAMIFLLGFVGFGVGGGFGGTGILSALSKEEGGGGSSYSSQITKYRKLTVTQPRNASAWEGLAKALLHEVGAQEDVTTNGANTKGKELYRQASQAWSSYLALNPPKANAELAQLMESAYSEEGLNEPAREVEVLQIAVVSRPTDAALYAQLAEYAYKAHNIRVGDLASAKAVSLAPASERTRLKQELAEVRKNPSGEKTYTTTTNGKTYTGKLNGNKELEATEVKTTTASSGKSSTTSK